MSDDCVLYASLTQSIVIRSYYVLIKKPHGDILFLKPAGGLIAALREEQRRGGWLLFSIFCILLKSLTNQYKTQSGWVLYLFYFFYKVLFFILSRFSSCPSICICLKT